MNLKFNSIIQFIRNYYNEPTGLIALHEPKFIGNEKKYVIDAIDSTYVSSVGEYVNRFEEMMQDYTGAKYAIATMNGTAALHMSLILAGVQKDELVITQPLSFIATCNAISYLKADPLFIDIDKNTLGLSAEKLHDYLKTKTEVKSNKCFDKKTGKRIAACVPMHTFGHPVEIDTIVDLCMQFHIPLIEDAAESIGSKYKNKHTGTFGLLGAFSFNGNKTITSGGGGCIVTDDARLAQLGKHLTTQAKVPHRWDFVHDRIGYNYRLPNLNAALACAQMERVDIFIKNKRSLATAYQSFFSTSSFTFIQEPKDACSNYWLNCILAKGKEERDAFLKYTNEREIIARPSWKLMHKLEMFKSCLREDLSNAEWIEDRLINLPSSVKLSL